MIEFVIPGKFDVRLGPNRTPYLKWYVIDKMKKPWADAAGWVVKASGIESLPAPVNYRIIIGLTKRQFANKGDDDNYAANLALKAIRDQMAKLLTNDDDSAWTRTGLELVEDPENKGYVKVMIES
jgi:hypothetical protein